MITAPTIATVRAAVAEARRGGARVGFVPTMGYLHQGHLSLVEEARRRSDFVVMSIFVNPLQFGAGEDLDRYPRDLARDTALAAGHGVDLLFVPTVEEMYPTGEPVVRVVPGRLAARLDGAARPGHFEGVLTVVAKLLNIVQPDVAIFGQKDFQQAVLVRRMVADLELPVEIVVAPIVREPDGLALSSRNVYLSPAERVAARALSRALGAADAAARAGERDAARLLATMRDILDAEPAVRPQYVELVDPATLEPVTTAVPGTVAAIAAFVGSTRLIDNVVLP
ncbi:MAG: pantoate--beta-alanine ligase [Gemmatimonadetes bacterium]|nr:pantoate--beta-alanine ligase [Gemmatimonadota bacterium]